MFHYESCESIGDGLFKTKSPQKTYFVKTKFELEKKTVDLLRALKPSFGYDGFGEFLFYRTYSRIKDNNQNENWADCVIRVTNGIMSIRKDWYIKNNIHWDETKWQDFAKHFSFSMFNMHWLPPGRGLWSMGTDYVYDTGSMSLFNCGFVTLKDIPNNLHWMMDALMNGVGVGFGIDKNSMMMCSEPNESKNVRIIIDDSREGWCDSVKILLESHMITGHPTVSFDYSLIRKAGLPIKRFGGISSGPEPLIKLHENIRKYCSRYFHSDGNYSSTMLKADLANFIGCCVVAGNVRRSAEIAIGSIDDTDFLNLKNYEEDKFNYRKEHGWMSNNTVRLEHAEDFEKLDEIAKSVLTRGEPGYLNLMNVKNFGRVGKYDNVQQDEAEGLNPCGEISLESYELCNLSETIPTRCKNIDEWYDAIRYATFYCSTVNLLPTHRQETNSVIFKNRRIGVALMDFVGWKHKHGVCKVTRWMREGYKVVEKTNKELAIEAGIRESIRKTTVKPGGCLTKDTLISTEKGLLKLEEIGNIDGETWQNVENLKVCTEKLNENKKVDKFFINGFSKTLKIETDDGVIFESTEKHKFLIFDGNNVVWKQACELLEGKDSMLVRLGTHPENGIVELKDVDKKDLYNNTFYMTEPKLLTEDIAWIIGIYFGDGSTHTKGIRISFNRKQPSLAQYIQKKFKEIFNLEAKIGSEHSDDDIGIGSIHLLKWLEINGFSKSFSYELEIPYKIRTANKEIARAFIEGFWRADGGCGSGGWNVCTVCEKFARQFQQLARSVGYNVNIRNAGPGGKGARDRWIVCSRCNDLEKKKYWKKEIKDRYYKDFWLDPIKNIYESENKTYDISVDEIHNYLANNSISHNTVPKLTGKSSGIGYPNFKIMKRRVRIQMNSPIYKFLIAHKVPHEKDLYSDNTEVFEFAVKSDCPREAKDASIWEQAMNIVLVQREWADNAVSNTICFKPKWVLISEECITNPDLKDITDLIEEKVTEFGIEEPQNYYGIWETFSHDCTYKMIADIDDKRIIVKMFEYNTKHEEDEIESVLSSIAPLTKSVSMLPHTSKGVYKQMPEEEMTEDEYRNWKNLVIPFDWSKLSKYQALGEKFCDGDRCSV